MAKTRKQSPLQKAYSTLRSKKAKHCKGSITKTSLNKAAQSYVKKAVAAGQTKSEATRKANRVVNGSCATAFGVSSGTVFKRGKISGTRKKKATRKKATRKRTTRRR